MLGRFRCDADGGLCPLCKKPCNQRLLDAHRLVDFQVCVRNYILSAGGAARRELKSLHSRGSLEVWEYLSPQRYARLAMGLELSKDRLRIIHRNVPKIPIKATLVGDDVKGRAALDRPHVQAGMVGVEPIVNASAGD